MPIYVRDEQSVLFIHIPKTGGTSIEMAMAKSGWRAAFRSSPRLEPDHYGYRRISPQHLHAALLRELLHTERFDVRFAVVRDPIARFRSEYAMRCKEPELAAAEHVEAWARRRLRAYDRNPYILDNHLRPQHEFMLDDTVVYRIEDGLDAAMADLAATHGVHVEAPLGRSEHKRGVPSCDVEISPWLEDRLREFYAEDFARFGY